MQNELRPHADEWEQARWFPNEVFGWLAEQGYIGLKFPTEYGGDSDVIADAVFCEELAWCGSGGLAAGIGAHGGIALPPIWKFGTEEQKQRYLVPGIRGEKIAALAITEPDAGSDVASIRTLAQEGRRRLHRQRLEDVHHRRLSRGRDRHGGQDDLGGRPPRALVPDHRAGRRRRVDARSRRWAGTRPTPRRSRFDDVFVPDENLLGEENAGFYLIMANFQWERLLMALGAVGGMQVAFEKTLKYALERKAFGKAIGHHQAIRHKLAEIAVTIEAGRDVTYSALRRYVAGEDAVREVTIAKLATQRAAFDVIDTCLQIHGGNGYMVEYGIERAARDARLGPIGGGTDEIMKEVLGRSLGLVSGLQV